MEFKRRDVSSQRNYARNIIPPCFSKVAYSIAPLDNSDTNKVDMLANRKQRGWNLAQIPVGIIANVNVAASSGEKKKTVRRNVHRNIDPLLGNV